MSATALSSSNPILTVRDLSISFVSKYRADRPVIRNVGFDIFPGEFVGLLGESGSGKSTLGNAILNLLAPSARITSGELLYKGKNLFTIPAEELRVLRWSEISTVFQSSMASLNPVMTVRAQMEDVFAAHRDPTSQRPITLEKSLDLVSIDHKYLDFYPHQLSGGMKQRIALAMSLLLSPDLIIFDEPTTGLDVVVQKSILSKLKSLQTTMKFAVLFISHDLGTVMEMAHRVMIMYAGEIVEDSPADEALSGVAHPYTIGLLGSYADPRDADIDIRYIPGRPPSLDAIPTGCAFADRCPLASAKCRAGTIPSAEIEAASGHRSIKCVLFGDETGGSPASAAFDAVGQQIEVHHALPGAGEVVCRIKDLNKKYSTRKGWKHSQNHAVVDVGFELRSGSVTALVGQSGSGKTTIGRILTGVEKPTSGSVMAAGIDVGGLNHRALRDYRSKVQMIFQDPFQALNPASSIGYAISRPLANHRKLRGKALKDEVDRVLTLVGLTPASEYRDRLPHELSGGQRQRVVIARALAANPEIIVADEPISMLDVSIRAEILQVLNELARSNGIAMLYITHDLLSARLIADEILVLHEGRIVEAGGTHDVLRNTRHPYTKLLLSSIPNPWKSRPKTTRGHIAAAANGHSLSSPTMPQKAMNL